MVWRSSILFSLLITAMAIPASAQRREANSADTQGVSVTLKTALAFGDKVLKAGKYRLSIRKGKLSFVDSSSMRTMLTLEAANTELKTRVPKPLATLKKSKSGTTIQLEQRNQRYTVKGIETKNIPKEKGVSLQKTSKFQVAEQEYQQSTPQQNVENALPRLEKGIEHCGAEAHKKKWRTGDKRFTKCLCPITERWRLPKSTADVMVHRPFEGRKHGYTIVVDPKGRVSACSVWAGSPQK